MCFLYACTISSIKLASSSDNPFPLSPSALIELAKPLQNLWENFLQYPHFYNYNHNFSSLSKKGVGHEEEIERLDEKINNLGKNDLL